MSDLEQCREKVLSEDYRDFILPLEGGRTDFPDTDENLCVQEASVGFEVAYLRDTLAEPMNFERFSYNTIPQCYTLLDMDAMNQSGISQVQYYPTLKLLGNGILIGFLDTGIDYTNDVFRNLDGTTRILGIWDQTIQSGTPPEEFYYGSAYSEEQINEALRSEDPFSYVPSRDDNSHGTFTASLACGSGNAENRFLGAAPESFIGVVKLKEAKRYLRDFYGITESAVCYQENDIMLGLRYLKELAEVHNLPLVVCLALGTSFGGHNAMSPLAISLQLYANSLNRIMVVGTGNEANQRHHYLGELSAQGMEETAEIQVGSGVEAFSAEIWTEFPNAVTVSVISPSGEVFPGTSIRQGTVLSYQFLFEGTEVYVDNRLLVEQNDAQLIFLRFRAPAPGIWKLRVKSVRFYGGVFHVWLPMKEFLSGDVIFLESNPYTTLTCPSSVDSVLSVAWYNGDQNSIDINSGRGYTRDGTIKPDLAAPGVGVMGALPGNRFVARSGSSVSVAIAAGASALLLEWLLKQGTRIGFDTSQVKGLLILGATGRSDMQYPNREWGYGALNLYETLQALREL